MKLSDEQLDQLIEYLRGTANSLSDGLRAIGLEDLDETELHEDTLKRIDDEIFVCEQCGWWCGNDEYGKKEGHCDECSPDTEDDEEDEDEED
jgi:hypothetical protein